MTGCRTIPKKKGNEGSRASRPWKTCSKECRQPNQWETRDSKQELNMKTTTDSRGNVEQNRKHIVGFLLYIYPSTERHVSVLETALDPKAPCCIIIPPKWRMAGAWIVSESVWSGERAERCPLPHQCSHHFVAAWFDGSCPKEIWCIINIFKRLVSLLKWDTDPDCLCGRQSPCFPLVWHP
jgi:hypothetical protein